MPPAVVAVAAAAVAGGGFFAPVTFGLVGQVVLGFAASTAFSFVTQALSPKPKAPQFSTPERQLSDRTQSIRQPISTGKLHYGRLRLGGAQTFAHKTENNGTTHILYTLGAAPDGFAGLDEIWFGDEQVTLGSYSAGNGYSISGKYSGKAKIWFGDGTTAGDADLLAALGAAVGTDLWTANHKQTGWAKLYVQIIWDNDTYPQGIPNITAVCRCTKGILDPRISGSPNFTGWTDCAALCLAHYLTTPKKWGGFGSSWSEIDEDELIAAANACDEMVSRVSVGVDFTATASDDTLTVVDKTAALRTGTRVTLSDSSSPGGTLPGGLSVDTDYFWIATGPLTGKLATSLANARAGTAIDLTSDTTGTCVLTVNAEPRYTCNGSADSADDPETAIGRMLSAMAGRLLRNSGKWKARAGVWLAADSALGQDDLIEGFSVNWFREPRDIYNGVKGTFTDPDSDWQPTDFPAVQIASYLAADQGEEQWKDADLPFTVSPSMAQRIARIDLERVRRQITTSWVCKLTALNIAAGDVTELTWSRYGWSGKTFEVSSCKPTQRTDGDGNPYLCMQLGFSEMDADAYAWTPADDEAVYTPAARTNLPSPSTVAAPTGLTLSSGTNRLYVRDDGTIFSRLRADWTLPADAYVTSGGQIEIQYRGPNSESPTPDWQPSQFVDGALTSVSILDVQDSQTYDVRIRSINILGAKSDWVEESHTVIGKTEPPSDVTGFSAQQNGGRVTFKWNQIADLDLAGYEIRYMAAPFIWENATVITETTRGTGITNDIVPPGSWVLGIKAKDTSGNSSVTASTFAIAVSNTFDIIYQTEQSPRWPGILQGFLRHDVSGALLPNSTRLASDMSDAELFDQFNAYPVDEACYIAKTIDVGFDASGLRVWSEAGAILGPGETAGVADPRLDIDYCPEAGALDGFEPWTIGVLTGANRFVSAEACINTASGKAYLTAFKPVVDVEERTQAVSQTIAAGGTRIDFSPPFHSTPRPSLTAEASGSPPEGRYVGWTDLDGTGGTFHVFSPAGSSVGGQISGDIVGA